MTPGHEHGQHAPPQSDVPVDSPTTGEPAGPPAADAEQASYADDSAAASGDGQRAHQPDQPDQPEEPEATGDQSAAPGEPEDELTRLHRELEERTRDLQRLQAEYLNYKRRVDRDRELVRQNATYQALAPITEVLDAIDRAREHGPLEDGFRVVAEQLERVVAGLGLTKFGEVGDAFDPNVHDALSHIGEDPDVQVTTCKVIAKSGYRIGDRVVRAAQVLVVDPGAPGAPATASDDE